MAQNARPISVREGIVLLEGIKVMDAVSFNLAFKPEVWEGSPPVGDS